MSDITKKSLTELVESIKNKKLTQWTKSEVGGLNTNNFVSPELVRIKSYDDL